MSVRASSDEIGPKLIEALGLPKNIKRLDLIFEAGKPVVVTCTVIGLDVGYGIDETIGELTEYELRKIGGPSLLPDIDAVKAAGGAQAWFDAEMSADSASTSDRKR